MCQVRARQNPARASARSAARTAAKLHLAALSVLKERGKNEGEYTVDEYISAIEEARGAA